MRKLHVFLLLTVVPSPLVFWLLASVADGNEWLYWGGFIAYIVLARMVADRVGR